MGVEFEEQNIARQLQYTTFGEKPKGISGKLISWGVAKDPRRANIILILITAVVVVITLFVIFSSRTNPDEQRARQDMMDIHPELFI